MARAAPAFLLAAACAAADVPAAPASVDVRVEASRMSMGCLYTIVALGADRSHLSAAAGLALDEVDRLDGLMSHYKPESPLSRLNRDAGRKPVPVERELYDLIALSEAYSRQSDGAFDITVGPLMKAWGFFRGDGRVPKDDELAALRRRVGYRHVALDPAETAIAFDTPGVEIDLGAIAKGYAVDRAVALLRRHGVRAALVSAGGSTIYALGTPPGSAGWRVDVQDPVVRNAVAFTLTLRDRALSVAGSSEKSFEIEGVEYTHILDPRTGRPVRGILGVVVLADDGTTGDALDTTLFVQGVEAGRATLRSHQGAEAYFLLPAQDRPWTRVHVAGR